MNHNDTNNNATTMSGELLQVVKDLSLALHPVQPGTTPRPITLDSAFDRDLGLDSLARVELLSQLEQRFHIRLPDSAFARTESPRDLLRLIQAASEVEQETSPSTPVLIEQPEITTTPHAALTLVDVMRWHLEHHPERTHIHLLSDDETQPTLSYSQLWQQAEQIAAGLQQQGIQPGDTVAIMLPTGSEYFFSFIAILLAGAVPVPIYPPLRRSQIEEHLRRHQEILRNCNARLLITVAKAKLFAELLKSQVPSLLQVATTGDLAASTEQYRPPNISADHIAFLQYTSGSTGSPKGVILTHGNLLANIRAMGNATNANAQDVFVSWLPLYHDMGLIGAWLSSMYFSATLVSFSPLEFLTRPQRWLQAISQYRGTLSASPNFGYELCMKHISEQEIDKLDLSSWRLAFNGAEPVSPATITNFSRHFARAGFAAESMCPVYGLAENTVGLAFPPLHRKPKIDHIERHTFITEGRAIVSPADDANSLHFVGCGHPLAGHQVRIVDRQGHELPERREGYLQFCGPSSTQGYFHNPQQTRKLLQDGWLNAGDLAYIAEGEIYITGRSKDVIIRAGRNIYPHELEEAVGNIRGIRKGCVAVFGSHDAASGTELLVVLAETRETDKQKKFALQTAITGAASALLDTPPDTIVLVPPHTVLKTSSGKIRRAANRQHYEDGTLEQPASMSSWPMLKLLPSLLAGFWRRAWSNMPAKLYAAYAWCLFGLVAPLGWLGVVFLPRLSWRWSTLRILSRFLAWASRTPLHVVGQENLPGEMTPGIVVANHCSYLDAYALVAVIPGPMSFIAKVEFNESFFSRLFLQRMQAETVARFDSQQGIRDAQRIASVAQAGKSLLFFPEGTFTRIPGLAPFRMGAFVSAANAGLPVIPIAIRGTRSMLRAHSWFPHRGEITLTIGQAIDAGEISSHITGNNWETALQLKNNARQFILQHCGEPDLGTHPPV